MAFYKLILPATLPAATQAMHIGSLHTVSCKNTRTPQSGPHCPRYERRLEGDTFHFPNSPCRTRDFTHNKLSETGLFPSSKHGGSSIVFDRKKTTGPLVLHVCHWAAPCFHLGDQPRRVADVSGQHLPRADGGAVNSHRTLGGSVDPRPGAKVLSGTLTNHADQLSLVTDLAFSGSAVGEALPAALDLVRDPCGGPVGEGLDRWLGCENEVHNRGAIEQPRLASESSNSSRV